MFKETPLIYRLIKNHNLKFNANKLFLSKKFRKKDEWFMKNVFAPFFLLFGTLTVLLLFFKRDNHSNTIGLICLIIILLFVFSYRYIYFNRRAKKDSNYKVIGNKFLDFFKWWITIKHQKKQLKKIKKHYSKKEFQTLIEAAKNEYEFHKRKK